MAESKSADIRREEILDAAQKLFTLKGYDATSTTDILKEVGIAKGTLYYHFSSKEEILDAMIERMGRKMLANARTLAANREIPLFQRLFLVMSSVNANENGNEEVLELIHNPQNALLHQKSRELVIRDMTPILTDLVEEGRKSGDIKTEFPRQTVEMVLIYVMEAFDADNQDEPQDMMLKAQAFIHNLEILFGTQKGAFDFVMQLF